MIRNTYLAPLAATAIVSLAIGFGAASLVIRPAEAVQPIINANAWDEAAPAPPAPERVSLRAASATMKCSPWEVSDVAMEEILDEMIRRGWRAPTQSEAFVGLDILPASGLTVIDANAPVPVRRTWTFSGLAREEAVDDVEETPAEAVIPSDLREPTDTTPQPTPPPA